MQKQQIYLSILTVIALTTVITMASLRHQERQAGSNSSNQQVPKLDKDKWPIADYENVEESDEKKRARREAKNKRYNNSLLGVRAVERAHEDIEVILIDDWEAGVPPLPISQSSLVVIGTVLDAKAFVSTDRTGVYSEFPVRIDEVLKDGWATQLDPNDVITVQRAGGRVKGRSASGLFRIGEQHMPRLGRQYVMFLRHQEGGEDYDLITGYEFRGGKVIPLDGGEIFAVYSNWNQIEFLRALRSAIVQP